MPVNKDSNGRRWVSAEVEVPGTPEEVWKAIATGKGISSWFVPTQVDEREGGAVNANFGPGMDSVSTITKWDPPHCFVADSRDDMGPGDPTVATEWIVEARAGGTCIVRVVHSWFTDADKWDNQFEGHTHGWQAFFRILRQYLAHFAGQPSAAFQLMGVSAAEKHEAWATLTAALGITQSTSGQRVTSSPGAPALSGIVEHAGPPDHPEELLLRLDAPAPGLMHLFALPMGGQVYLPIRIFLYGHRATEIAHREEPRWQRWINEILPPSA
jgi:uncharacterized protein YndB with AHSA1/START domain